MDTQLDGTAAQAAADQQPPIDPLRRVSTVPKEAIDPLRRVFVPIEKRTAAGTTVFRTTDRELYMRHTDGSIRRVTPKVNGKQAKRQRHACHP